MPIALWILHLIKNTAADTNVGEAEDEWKGKGEWEEKREGEKESKGGRAVMFKEKIGRGEKVQLNRIYSIFQPGWSQQNKGILWPNVYTNTSVPVLRVMRHWDNQISPNKT
jgi:hypothetical protein